MKKQAMFFLALVVLSIGTFVLLARFVSPVFQRCIEQNESPDYYGTPIKQVARYKVVIPAYARCSGRFLDAHGGGITALATIVIAAFTGTLWVVSYRQWSAANQALLLQFRPRLIVRNIVLDPLDPKSVGFKKYPVASGYPITGQFYIANVGGSAATIKEILSFVFWKKRPSLPMRRPYEGDCGFKLQTRIQLEPGQSTFWKFDSRKLLDVTPDQICRCSDQGDDPRVDLYVMGWVEYSDDLGYGRRTAFCRKFDPPSARFKAVDDPDYEHAE